MATRYIEASDDPTAVPGDNAGNVRKIGIDTDDEKLKWYDRTNSATLVAVTENQTQTLTNKTLTSPAITNPTVTGLTPISVTGAATFGATHVGRTAVLNAVAGGQIDLPEATGSGNKYRAVVGTALTSASWVFRTNVTTGDRFTGGVTINDSGDTAAETADFFPAGASDEVLTLAFAATLGTIGAYVEFEDFKTGLWAVSGHLGSSVDPATPWGVATT